MENTFGGFLKEKRLEKNLTQKEMAKMLFVSESAVSKWEKDVAHPDITLLPKLAEILGVTEHELITASVDEQAREEKMQAKKWRNLSSAWRISFYIAYGIALIPCFICNLAIEKTLSWFWIVLSALLLAFTFTNLPKLIKKNKLLFLPLAMYGALCLLLGVCCIYSHGDWFWIASIAVLLGLSIIFVPIYIAKYKVFEKIRKFNDFISILFAFILLNILLLVIEAFNPSDTWYLKIAFPIALGVYLSVNLLLCVRFLKVNRFIKTSLILIFFPILYLILPLIKVDNANVQDELNQFNIFLADFSLWNNDVAIERNLNLIVFLSFLAIAAVFFTVGLLWQSKKKKQ